MSIPGANLLKALRYRFGRGFSLTSLGPNEARLVYDLLVVTVALAVSALFGMLFLGKLVGG